MSTAEVSSTLKELIGDAKVIDVDTHFTEPPDLWTSRAPAQYKDKVPHMKTVDGVSRWFVKGDNPWLSVGVGVMDQEGRKVRGKLRQGGAVARVSLPQPRRQVW